MDLADVLHQVAGESPPVVSLASFAMRLDASCQHLAGAALKTMSHVSDTVHDALIRPTGPVTAAAERTMRAVALQVERATVRSGDVHHALEVVVTEESRHFRAPESALGERLPYAWAFVPAAARATVREVDDALDAVSSSLRRVSEAMSDPRPERRVAGSETQALHRAFARDRRRNG